MASPAKARWLVVVCVAIGGCIGSGQRMNDGVHFEARLEPPAGRVIHGWGQISGQWTRDDPAATGDESDFAAYVAAVKPYQPAMVSFYVAPVQKQVDGFLRKYGAFAKANPFFITQIGFYFRDRFLHEAIVSGEADGEIEKFLTGLQRVGRPVLLRIGHEFNGDGAEYDPELYKKAFVRIARMIREGGFDNVATVWHAEVLGLRNRDCLEWYPGDEYVDWWGISLFFADHMVDPKVDEFIVAARQRKKPVLIGESSPWFHATKEQPVRAGSPDEVRQWYAGLFAVCDKHPHVKAISVIVVDWTRWNSFFANVPGGFPDTRFEVTPGMAERYREYIGRDRFIHSAEAAGLYGGRDK